MDYDYGDNLLNGQAGRRSALPVTANNRAARDRRNRPELRQHFLKAMA